LTLEVHKFVYRRAFVTLSKLIWHVTTERIDLHLKRLFKANHFVQTFIK
jgi:hypothetical protein